MTSHIPASRPASVNQPCSGTMALHFVSQHSSILAWVEHDESCSNATIYYSFQQSFRMHPGKEKCQKLGRTWWSCSGQNTCTSSSSALSVKDHLIQLYYSWDIWLGLWSWSNSMCKNKL
jgi:hypothetical protein